MTTTTTTSTGPARRPARWATAVRLRAGRLGLHGLALTGDPVARWALGSPRTDVYALYERIRAAGPVVRSRAGVHAVTGRELCEAVLRDPRFGVRGPDSAPAAVGTDPADADRPVALSGSFLEMDGADHTRLRRAVAPAFRPKLVRGWADRADAVLDELVDRAEAIARRDGRVDLMAEIAAPFPIAIISDLLGVPDVDAAEFRRIGGLAGDSLDGVRSLRQVDELRAAGTALQRMFTRLLDEKAADPRDDVLSTLAAARAEGTISVEDAIGVAGLLLIAGFETTVNLIGNGLAALHGQPGRWQELADDPGLAPAVVEEALRFDPSVQGTARVAQTDVELAGTALPRGSVVLVLTAAANRDPATYTRPAVFDPHRTGEPDHLTFSSGVHYCLGAPLARLEGEVALRTLARRWPRLRLLPGAARRPTSTIRGFAALPAVPVPPG